MMVMDASFDITVTGLDWFPNFEGNRWFLVMKLSKPSNDGLNKLLQLSNKGLAAFEQRPLYDEGEKDGSIFRRDLSQADTRGKGRGRGRRTSRDQTPAGGESTTEYVPDYSSYFHISIAWRLDEPTTEGKSQAVGSDLKELESLSIKFSNVKVKIGNAVHSIALPVETIDQKGFGGL
jgi:U6 snRNA phosphodiesterase